MSRKGTRKSSADSQNLVTILFVLGVIGWGFFAIDRLTDTEGGRKNPKVQGRASGQEAGWKKTARDWLTKKLSSSEAPEKHDTESPSVSRNVPQGEIPLLPEPGGLSRAQQLPEEEETLTQNREVEAPESAEFLLYRLNNKGQPVLAKVKRSLGEGKGDARQMLGVLIKGPTPAETERDFIDSFVRKPRVLSVARAGSCAVVDFDANFGAGVSYQTLRFQIEQIYRNLKQWTGSKCLELKVRGQYTPHLGSDGIFFPKRIDEHWLRENS